MAFPANRGFQHIQGPGEVRWSNVSSTATFTYGAPVIMGLGRTVTEANAVSDDTTIFGIAQADAADSIGGPLAGKVPILIPTHKDVFAARVQTGVAGSALSAGLAYNIEKSGDNWRVDTDSQASARVQLVERGYGQDPHDSADSSVYCQFLAHAVGDVYASTSSGLLTA